MFESDVITDVSRRKDFKTSGSFINLRSYLHAVETNRTRWKGAELHKVSRQSKCDFTSEGLGFYS